MRVLFCRSHTLISWLIRLVTWSDWSHTILIDPDGIRTVQAVWPRVMASTLAADLEGNEVTQMVDLPCADPAAAMAWARSQVGKPYDWRSDLGIAFHRLWTDPGQWECAGLIAAAFIAGGTPLFRADALGRVTPQMLWQLPGKDVAA